MDKKPKQKQKPTQRGASMIAQRVKAPATKPGELRFNPCTLEEEEELTSCCLTSIDMHQQVCVCLKPPSMFASLPTLSSSHPKWSSTQLESYDEIHISGSSSQNLPIANSLSSSSLRFMVSPIT